ncbi:MAG: ribonuclease R family protein [Gammaproteobacteria bacterium]
MPGEFSAELSQAAEDAAKNPQKAQREDFRNLDFITIDGADARDFDDAVRCTPLPGGGFCLQTAIADVAAFVLPGSPLDEEARRRGNSVYLPDRVLPMLPAALSNGACSLSPDEDKLCLFCEMEIRGGEIEKYRFARGVMRSQRRTTYEEAAAEMSGKLHPLSAVAQELKQTRQKRGAFIMEIPEMRAVVSDSGVPELLEIRRNEAHIAVEECMIAANRCAADFVISRELPALHRIHRKPAAESLENLRRALRPLGIDFPAHPAAGDFSAALEAVSAKDEALAGCFLPVLLGALARAEYAPDEKTGHFGLSCARYLHFTSPIRRYPDLLAHRAVIAGIAGQKNAAEDLSEIGAHCSQTEIAADKAGWECRQRLLCLRAADKIGEEYEVAVSGVTHFGVFVAAAELGADGLMRFSSLPGYWEYNAGLRRATHRASGRVLELGSRLRARLSAVSPEKGRADFIPVE